MSEKQYYLSRSHKGIVEMPAGILYAPGQVQPHASPPTLPTQISPGIAEAAINWWRQQRSQVETAEPLKEKPEWPKYVCETLSHDITTLRRLDGPFERSVGFDNNGDELDYDKYYLASSVCWSIVPNEGAEAIIATAKAKGVKPKPARLPTAEVERLREVAEASTNYLIWKNNYDLQSALGWHDELAKRENRLIAAINAAEAVGGGVMTFDQAIKQIRQDVPKHFTARWGLVDIVAVRTLIAEVDRLQAENKMLQANSDRLAFLLGDALGHVPKSYREPVMKVLKARAADAGRKGE